MKQAHEKEYVVLVSSDPSFRKSIHRHIIEADNIEDAADKCIEVCSHGPHIDTVVEVFPSAGSFFSFDLRQFIPPDARQG